MRKIEDYKITTELMTKEQAYKSRDIQEKLVIDDWFAYKSFASVSGDDEVTIIMFKEDLESVEKALKKVWEDFKYETDYSYCHGEDEVELVGEFNHEIFTEMCRLDGLVEFKVNRLNFIL